MRFSSWDFLHVFFLIYSIFLNNERSISNTNGTQKKGANKQLLQKYLEEDKKIIFCLWLFWNGCRKGKKWNILKSESECEIFEKDWLKNPSYFLKNSIIFSVAIFIGIFFFHTRTVLAESSGLRGRIFTAEKSFIKSVWIVSEMPIFFWNHYHRIWVQVVGRNYI